MTGRGLLWTPLVRETALNHRFAAAGDLPGIEAATRTPKRKLAGPGQLFHGYPQK